MEPEDEWPHLLDADQQWAEWWYFDFAAAEGTGGDAPLAGCVRLCLMPQQNVARYWASLVGASRLPVVVHDDEVPLPRNGSMEIRTEGLWADHVIEGPFEQVGVGCEAFGLRLDSLADLERNPVVGERVPFGLDLEWGSLRHASLRESRSGSSPVGEPPVAGDGSQPQSMTRDLQGYQIACHVLGEVLVGDERLQIDAPGNRSHGWGTQLPPFVPRLDVVATHGGSPEAGPA